MKLGSILLGNIVTSESPSGKLDIRNFINIIFVGLLGCAPIFLNSISAQISTLSWGNYGYLLPIILMIIKGIAELLIDKSKSISK